MMQKWLGRKFKTSTGKTAEFMQFARDFKRYVSGLIPGCTFMVGHFYISGFCTYNGKTCYFSIDDVRFSPDGWYNEVLYRSAKSTKDFTGGQNHYCKLPELADKMKLLMQEG